VCLAEIANTNFTRVEDVIYARKAGTALTLDVFTPPHTNGCGLLWIVSAGYGSSHEAIKPEHFRAFLARGYTMFAVVHGSAPKFSVREAEQDVLRAGAFVRSNAFRYGVNPARIGAIGASAGGHLALTLATKGDDVACVAAFFPPTDYLNYGKPGLEAAWIAPLLGMNTNAATTNAAAEGTRLRREISPIYFVRSNQPPVLIFQGDKDYMVPVDQARTFVKRSEELGNKTKLIIKPGRGHGWAEMGADMDTAADWFDEHLRGKASPAN
jgi:acetyl esterase/lipase